MKQQARLHGEDGFARAVSAIDLAVRTAPPGRKSEYFLRSGAAAAGAKGKKHPDADVIRKLSREFDDLVGDDAEDADVAADVATADVSGYADVVSDATETVTLSDGVRMSVPALSGVSMSVLAGGELVMPSDLLVDGGTLSIAGALASAGAVAPSCCCCAVAAAVAAACACEAEGTCGAAPPSSVLPLKTSGGGSGGGTCCSWSVLELSEPEPPASIR